MGVVGYSSAERAERGRGGRGDIGLRACGLVATVDAIEYVLYRASIGNDCRVRGVESAENGVCRVDPGAPGRGRSNTVSSRTMGEAGRVYDERVDVEEAGDSCPSAWDAGMGGVDSNREEWTTGGSIMELALALSMVLESSLFEPRMYDKPMLALREA